MHECLFEAQDKVEEDKNALFNNIEAALAQRGEEEVFIIY